MKIGDVVEPTKRSGFILRSGCEFYGNAIVISLNPFMITSPGADMLWVAIIKIEDFKVTGVADKKTLKKCMRRLPINDYNLNNLNNLK